MADPTETPPAGGDKKPEAGNARLSAIFNRLWNDPKYGSEVRRVSKEMFPDVQLIEDQLDPVVAPLREQLDATQAELKALQEERAAEKAEREERTAAQTFEERATAAREKYRLTGEGFDKMIEHMRETENYTDFEGAAAWVAGQTPPPAQPGPYLGPQNLNLFGSSEKDEKWALLHKDPAGAFLDAEFTDFIRDPRQYVLDAGFNPDA